ncbi:hypothetical protein [Arthrobacter sp. CG_A4]|uniref:hypothetical protein n=1 Tax=Arthrobacter sp. CG_A4 TaxID=3071706 RepID=UPI002E1230B6
MAAAQLLASAYPQAPIICLANSHARVFLAASEETETLKGEKFTELPPARVAEWQTR